MEINAEVAIYEFMLYNIIPMEPVTNLPDLNCEFAGISDAVALRAEISGMTDALSLASDQLVLERELAKSVHRARSQVIMESPALRLVFEVDDDHTPDTSPAPTVDDILTSAFVRKINGRVLPDGFATTVAKSLRHRVHTDTGGDTNTAQQVGMSLNDMSTDPALSVASAILAAPSVPGSDAATLRKERYRISLALDGAEPHFASEDDARESAELEIDGAEWRVRTQAVFKTFELIIGNDDVWNQFLNSIVNERHAYLIDMVNRLQPVILSLQERLAKGQPRLTESLDIDAIDAVFERVWTTIGDRNSSIRYSPPYQNWLEILLPAMQMLDPGQKLGAEYTYFQPPIQIRRTEQHFDDSDECARNLGRGLLKFYQETDRWN